jgi:hypothetical protein
MALVDQHIVPSNGTENRTSDVLPWDGLSSMRHLAQPKDARVALLLSSKYLPSVASYPLPALEETLDGSLLASPLKRQPDVSTCSLGDRRLALP